MKSTNSFRILAISALCLYSMAAAPLAPNRVYPKRWVYVSNLLASDQDVATVLQIVETAAAHGLNGMVLYGGFDRIDLMGPEYFAHLKQVKDLCDRLGIEIIPTGFGTGYGGALLAHDPNLAEGLPVKRALFVAEKDRAAFRPEREALALASSGSGPVVRFAKQIEVIPYRDYKVSLRIRGTAIAPGATLEIRADTLDKRRNRCWFESDFRSSSDWREIATGFNSAASDKLNFNIGVEDGVEGKVEIADLRIEEVGLLNVVRRPGTPLAVRGDKNGIVYVEGRDFAPISDPNLTFRFDHDNPTIQLTAASRIREGERLRVDYYHGALIYRDQVPACKSEPKVFEIWSKQFPLIQKYLAPKTFLLTMDEERMGGTCQACRRRGMSMAAVLGENVTRLRAMIQASSPGAEIFVWSDMFDPNHNARPNYYLVEGDYSGSWKYLPKDTEIACWNFDTRERSLAHFSKLGFKTLAAAYYDADDLKNPAGWLESLDHTPGAVGIMYTTWNNKYKLLPAFGDMVSKR